MTWCGFRQFLHKIKGVMPTKALTGSRIREQRMALWMRQAELAARAGVSASHLNLIKHHRRRVLGSVPARLSQGAVFVNIFDKGKWVRALGPRGRAEPEALLVMTQLILGTPHFACLPVRHRHRATRGIYQMPAQSSWNSWSGDWRGLRGRPTAHAMIGEGSGAAGYRCRI